jgi:hypothetical protein
VREKAKLYAENFMMANPVLTVKPQPKEEEEEEE